MSVEKLKDGFSASGAFCSAGAVGSSAHAAMKGKEIARNEITHTSAFFLIADEFISFAPFLMVRLELPFLSCSFLLRRPWGKSISVPRF
jgi:hypothetical protein